jgi:CubicO group peptidase (beta-lactamase class C family)
MLMFRRLAIVFTLASVPLALATVHRASVPALAAENGRDHLQAEALKTVRPGTGWGMDFRVIMDAAAAGEPVSDGTFDWYGIAGTWFWIDPVSDLVFVGMIQHRGRANGEIAGVSRNLVYQALVN